ncbi:MAG TPA: 2-oxo-tetronate isomerase [Hypericibacter adhaerens]|jgi:hydroxypyruvate isomerase|uniref:Hydroxypyruvate isomerase n=1 Tax=Hypericibacter adhaerens TaxID=2602016 RepID=A0A5J6N9W6_9PROT|nr:2-oxo-tetronate isomerase [Hypericibacter adhaerens]QEX24366.1 hydroxypyruvate isomerase [Hypericibacter adhaerens]HWA44113.1 2-oxo-tetronate isomerase [Hypericibacter adhaerens]
MPGPKLAANLSMIFQEVEFLDRFAAAAAVGFHAVECLFPYPFAASEIRSRLEAWKLEQVLFNAAQGDFEKGERGIAGLPGREADFRRAIDLALDYAQTLRCPRIHVMAGLVPLQGDPRRHREVYVENLSWAAGQARSVKVDLMLEPLNAVDFPGYLIGTPQAARSVIEEVGASNIKLQYDVYHAQMTHGRLLDNFAANQDIVGHVQIAGVPGRNEPDDSQEINYRAVFAGLERMGYDGWIGCEYRPKGDTVAGLGWAAPYGIGARGAR